VNLVELKLAFRKADEKYELLREQFAGKWDRGEEPTALRSARIEKEAIARELWELENTRK
jgi:hypothetical protein